MARTQTLVFCRGSLSPCDSMSRTCRAAYPACAKPVSALIIAPEVAFPCALYAAQCGKTVRGLLTHSDDDPGPLPEPREGVRRIIHEPTGTDHRCALLSRSHAMVVAQGRASLPPMLSRIP